MMPGPADLSSVETCLQAAAQRLAAISPTPGMDARALLAYVTGWSQAGLIRAGREALDTDSARRFEALLARRAAGEPIAHITGQREFWSLPLAVTRDTLIPRADTELLVEVVLARNPRGHLRVVDAGTGSGAVALALAVERPAWQVVAIELCPAALAVARGNAGRIAAGNVLLVRGSWLEAFAHGSLDVVAANPPYVSDDDPHLLGGDVRHEPRLALTAGREGLDAIRILARQARRSLRADGSLWLEHGADQGQAVRSILAAAGFSDIETAHDLAGHPRVSGGCSRRPPQRAWIRAPRAAAAGYRDAG